MNSEPRKKEKDNTKANVAFSLKQRYRGIVPEIIVNDTLRLLLSHRSVRSFSSEELPEGLLETICAAAQSTSTSSNLQAWSVIAVKDQDRKARLARLAMSQAAIFEAPMFLVWLVDLSRLRNIAASLGHAADGLDYLDCFLLGAVDAALAAQTAMIALESMGLGGVYIGAIRSNPIAVAAELGLPDNAFALFGMAVGRPDVSQPTAIKPRLPQAAVLFREKYTWGDQQRSAVEQYNSALREFQIEQGLVEQNWTLQATERVRDAASLYGRDKLLEELNKLGFGLR